MFFKDIATIIASILIALYIKNRNEDRKDEKYLNQMYSSIEKELEESRIESS
jgi:hypothetical protein